MYLSSFFRNAPAYGCANRDLTLIKSMSDLSDICRIKLELIKQKYCTVPTKINYYKSIFIDMYCMLQKLTVILGKKSRDDGIHCGMHKIMKKCYCWLYYTVTHTHIKKKHLTCPNLHHLDKSRKHWISMNW